METTIRPKKNKIYLHYHYNGRDGAKEQNFDMIFWNEKFLSELFKYSRLDDGIHRILEIIESYKERLARSFYKGDSEKALKDYTEYVKTKLAKVKLIVDLNEKWHDKEIVLEHTGFDWDDILDLGTDKTKHDNMVRELGTFKELLK